MCADTSSAENAGGRDQVDVHSLDACTTSAASDALAFLEAQRKTAEDAIAQNLEGVVRSRKRADSWGKGVVSVSTTLLAVLGIGKLTDFLPQSGTEYQIGATVALVIALGAVMFVGLRLSRVSLPIVMRADVDDMKKDRETNPDGLGKKELALVRQVYQRFAALNGVDSVADFALVATVIERTFTILTDHGKNPQDIKADARPQVIDDITEKICRPTRSTSTAPDPQITRTYVEYSIEHPDLARAKAALVRTELRFVMTNALADLTDRRSVNATADRIARATLALVPVGVLAAAVLTYFGNINNLSRTEQWQDAKTCLEVLTAVKQNALEIPSPICAFPPPLSTESEVPESSTPQS